MFIRKIGNHYYVCKRQGNIKQGKVSDNENYTDIHKLSKTWSGSIIIPCSNSNITCPTSFENKKIRLRVEVVKAHKKTQAHKK